jgi:hypothetical protein
LTGFAVLIVRRCHDCAAVYVTREWAPFCYDHIICPRCRGVQVREPRVSPKAVRPPRMPKVKVPKVPFKIFNIKIRVLRAIKPPKPTLTKTCVCGTTFITRDPHRKFCTPACAQRFHHALRATNVRAKRGVRVCPRCGKELPATMINGAIYCSDRCQLAFTRAQKRVPRPARRCDYCGTLYTPGRSTQRYCSVHCRDQFYERRAS